MSSRIRSRPDHVFEMFCEVANGSDGDEGPFILQKYPESFNDEEILKSVPSFVYPCQFNNQNVLHFSFVLTSIDSKWTFGFVRHSKSPSSTCLVLLSSLPWHESFYKLLNHISSLTNMSEALHLTKFLDALYECPLPMPGTDLTVTYYVHAKEFSFDTPTPDHSKLPSIPEDRNLLEYINAVSSDNMITIFASMLNERRIMITSSRLSRLTACIQAANSLIYPMFWEHIFIPVLPKKLMDYLSAPMPFLIGVPTTTFNSVKKHELGDIVILDADNDSIETPFDDVHSLPTDIIQFLKKSLKPVNNLMGDQLARTFLMALVRLIGGYRDALSFQAGQRIKFDKDKFIKSRPLPMQPFLEKMLQLQIFQQFIEGRLLKLHEGEGFTDEFELALSSYDNRQSANNLKMQYKEWLFSIKKEGNHLLKSVNPAVKSAYRQVKVTSRQVRDKSKQAYRGIKSKINEKPHNVHRPQSAPSSPSSSPISRRRLPEPFPRKGSNGFVVERDDKTVSYVRPRDSVNGKMPSVASCNDLLDTNFDSLSSAATEPEPSTKHLIDFDLMNEVEEEFSNRFCVNADSSFSPKFSSSPMRFDPFVNNSTNASNISASMIANTSRANYSMTSKVMSPEDLIKLESPPEDELAAIFDPLALRPKQPSMSTPPRNGHAAPRPVSRGFLPPPTSGPSMTGKVKKPEVSQKPSSLLFQEFAFNSNPLPTIPSPIVREMANNSDLFNATPFNPSSNPVDRPFDLKSNNHVPKCNSSSNNWQKFE